MFHSLLTFNFGVALSGFGPKFATLWLGEGLISILVSNHYTSLDSNYQFQPNNEVILPQQLKTVSGYPMKRDNICHVPFISAFYL